MTRVYKKLMHNGLLVAPADVYFNVTVSQRKNKLVCIVFNLLTEQT